MLESNSRKALELKGSSKLAQLQMSFYGAEMGLITWCELFGLTLVHLPGGFRFCL
jgi:hypothetical protein